jgi:hypothetical protein
MLPALLVLSIASQALAQAPPPSAPPPSAPPPGAQEPEKKPGFLRAYHFRPYVYGGGGLGLSILPAKNNLCPGGITCIGGPVGFGFALDVGARFHYLVALELNYDAFFHMEDDDYYRRATWQAITLDLRIYALAGSVVEIYALAGGGVNFFGDQYKADVTGGGFEVGAGVDFVPAPSFTIGAKVMYRGGVFPEFRSSFTDDATGDKYTIKQNIMHGIFIMFNLQLRYIIVGAS